MNIYWQACSRLTLSTFGCLEISFPVNSSLVWLGASKAPASLVTYAIWWVNLELMLVVPPSGQNWNLWNVQFEFSSGAIWLVNSELTLVALSGQNWNQWSVYSWIFFYSEIACFVAGEIIQVIEAMPGSVVPLAMFWIRMMFQPNLL